jgi:hypothetical protein
MLRTDRIAAGTGTSRSPIELGNGARVINGGRVSSTFSPMTWQSWYSAKSIGAEMYRIDETIFWAPARV